MKSIFITFDISHKEKIVDMLTHNYSCFIELWWQLMLFVFAF